MGDRAQKSSGSRWRWRGRGFPKKENSKQVIDWGIAFSQRNAHAYHRMLTSEPTKNITRREHAQPNANPQKSGAVGNGAHPAAAGRVSKPQFSSRAAPERLSSAKTSRAPWLARFSRSRILRRGS